MILLPISHENMTVRRLPWVSITIAALSVLAHIVVATGHMGREQDIQDQYHEAVEYFFSHPYLTAQPEDEKVLQQVFGRDLDELRAAAFPVQSDEEEEERRLEQAELDRLFQKARDTLNAHPFFRFGLVPADISIVALFTHMFLHGGWFHLLGNLFFLYLAGPFVEDAWGRPLYTAFYLVAGLGAALTMVLFTPDSTVPMVGASGAIAGLMGAFLVRYFGTKIQFFYMVGVWVRGTFWAPAWLMLPLWLAQQVFYALLTDSTGGGIAYWAHVGGFVVGAAGAYGVRQLRFEEKYVAPVVEKQISTTVEGSEVIEAAYAERAAGRLAEGLAVLQSDWARRPGNPHVGLVLWVFAVEAGRAAEAAPVLLEVIRRELREGEKELALTHWRELHEQVADPCSDAQLLLRMAAVLADRDRTAAARALHQALLVGQKTLNGAAALKIARLARKLDPSIAIGAAQLALTHRDLSPEEKDDAERILREASGVPVAR